MKTYNDIMKMNDVVKIKIKAINLISYSSLCNHLFTSPESKSMVQTRSVKSLTFSPGMPALTKYQNYNQV